MKKLVLYIPFLLFFPQVKAQDENAAVDTVGIDTVVVTGTRIAVSRDYVPLTLSVVNGRQIEESSESALLPVLTQWVPGLFVTQRGVTGFGVAQGSAGQITIRGVGGNPNTQVLVLLNGNPQYMGIFGHPLPDAYIASDVERVEVVRGPASTLYGSNAMGGVINIITKEEKKEGLSAHSRLMYGSYNTGKYMAQAGFRKKGFSIFASVNHDRTDGHRDSSEFRITNGYLDMGYRFSPHFSARFYYSVARFHAMDPGPVDGHAGNEIGITRGMGALVLNNTWNQASGSLRFFYNYGIHNISDGFHSTDKNYGIVWYEAFHLFPGNTLTLGVDYKDYGGNAMNRLAFHGEGIVFADTSLHEVAGYLFVQQKLGTQWMISGGFRLEHNEEYGNIPVPTGGVTWRPAGSTILKASVSKGFRSPTIRELYMWGPANPDLDPEEMMNYEVSYEQHLLTGRLSFNLALYIQDGDNLIRTVLTDDGPRNLNTGSFRNKGLELAARYRPLRNLSFHANLSWIDMDKPVLATPGFQSFLHAHYQWEKIAIDLSWQSTHGLYLTTDEDPRRTSYDLLSARIRYDLNPHLSFFVKGENLTDTPYEINEGYPMPGICIFGGLNLGL